MINLIKNEFYKIKISKIITSYIFFITLLLLMNKYSDKSIEELSFNIVPFIGIFICLFWGGTISNEIEKGTFRFYLTKPVSRHKVYVSKLITTYIYTYIGILLILFVSSIISSKIDLLYYSKFLTYGIPLYFLSTLIIYLSNKFKNTSFTIICGVLLFSFSLLLSQILFKIKFNFIEFTFLPYLDFTLFDDENNLKAVNSLFNVSLSLKRGVLIDIIYTFIFYLFGAMSFMKRDIKS